MTEPRWFTSSYSNDQGGSCVEAARLDNGQAMAIRDTKDRTLPAFTFTGDAWNTFLTTVKEG
ncbi:DUF397 domain-containing protein [Streptomyces sedi]|uniref:DUF397 domain-containing protein n=1 Tax=Streptomyces sedi TaxID=555059 RepID=UPI0031EBF7D9